VIVVVRESSYIHLHANCFALPKAGFEKSTR
jgi:hypothetical protein